MSEAQRKSSGTPNDIPSRTQTPNDPDQKRTTRVKVTQGLKDKKLPRPDSKPTVNSPRIPRDYPVTRVMKGTDEQSITKSPVAHRRISARLTPQTPPRTRNTATVEKENVKLKESPLRPTLGQSAPGTPQRKPVVPIRPKSSKQVTSESQSFQTPQLNRKPPSKLNEGTPIRPRQNPKLVPKTRTIAPVTSKSKTISRDTVSTNGLRPSLPLLLPQKLPKQNEEGHELTQGPQIAETPEILWTSAEHPSGLSPTTLRDLLPLSVSRPTIEPLQLVNVPASSSLSSQHSMSTIPPTPASTPTNETENRKLGIGLFGMSESPCPTDLEAIEGVVTCAENGSNFTYPVSAVPDFGEKLSISASCVSSQEIVDNIVVLDPFFVPSTLVGPVHLCSTHDFEVPPLPPVVRPEDQELAPLANPQTARVEQDSTTERIDFQISFTSKAVNTGTDSAAPIPADGICILESSSRSKQNPTGLAESKNDDIAFQPATPIREPHVLGTNAPGTAFSASVLPRIFSEIISSYGNLGFNAFSAGVPRESGNRRTGTQRELEALRASAGVVLARARAFGQTLWSPSIIRARSLNADFNGETKSGNVAGKDVIQASGSRSVWTQPESPLRWRNTLKRTDSLRAMAIAQRFWTVTNLPSE